MSAIASASITAMARLKRARDASPALLAYASSASMLLAAFTLAGADAAATPVVGLSARNGAVLLEGKPFHGIGANYFSLFSRLLENPEDTSSLSNLAALAGANIPFVRFMCGGYWPAEQRLYLENRDLFFQRLDRVVRAAEQNHIGFVPSLFWHLPTVADLAGEPMQELGSTNSKSIALLRNYTREVVTRYMKSPAIWAWEFGNEATLSADLPNARDHRPPTVPSLGTPAARSEKDELRFAQVRTAFITFAETVRQLDRDRMIISGNALPRASAWHQARENSWKPDTAEQFHEVLLRDNPDPIDSLSVHIYYNRDGRYPAGARTIDDIVALTARSAARSGKPLFLGEFGAERQLGSPAEQKAIFAEFLAAIERHRVPLAAFWVFDFPGMEKDWNVSFQNDRVCLLQLVTEANTRRRSAPR